jgi:hypothetical protein
MRSAAVVVITTVAVVLVKAATAKAPPAPRRATPAEEAALAAAIASSEPRWLVETEQAFPRDRWSARDDFHGRELRDVQTKARELGVPMEDVLRAIDDDIHRSGHRASARASDEDADPRSARAVPCKPRPIYD